GHGEGIDLEYAVAIVNAAHAMIEAEQTQYCSQKVVGIVVRMEADKVCVDYTLQVLAAALTGQQPENSVRGQRDVEEEADFRLWHFLAKHTRHEHQLVVMHPDCVVFVGNFCNGISKALVYLYILAPVVL